MKTKNITFILTITATLLLTSGFYSCKIKETGDLNNPSQAVIEANASVDEMNNLVAGMLSGMRPYLSTYLDDCGVIGRDYYRISGSDPRFTADLLGKESAVLDANTFYLVNPWNSFYQVIRNGWILRHAVDNTTAALTDGEKNGYRGFAKTIQAMMELYNLNLTYDNGIRLVSDMEDPFNLGPFTSNYNDALDGIIALLDEGNADLNNADATLAFPLTSGFSGFDDRDGLNRFNRALAARCNLYRGNYSTVLTNLSESFYDQTGAQNAGVYITYSSSSGDLTNDMYYPNNSPVGGNVRIVQPSFITDAEAGDLRVAEKTFLRSDTAFADGLSGTYDVNVWQSLSDPICIIRNEELILIDAEAKNQTSDAVGAVADIDAIRGAAGLTPYAGPVDQASLTDEILNQRRYSLFAEGDRWVDMRRYNKLGDLPIDRPGDDVWLEFPVPADENQ